MTGDAQVLLVAVQASMRSERQALQGRESARGRTEAKRVSYWIGNNVSVGGSAPVPASLGDMSSLMSSPPVIRRLNERDAQQLSICVRQQDQRSAHDLRSPHRCESEGSNAPLTLKCFFASVLVRMG